MDWSSYRSLDAVNWSSLKWLAVSPAHYRYHLLHPRSDSPAMLLGRAVHAAVLEPTTLPLQYTTYDGSRRGKDWTEFKEVNSGKDILTVEEWQKVIAIQQAVEQHPVAGPLLTGGLPEVTIRWQDEATRTDCKARADYVNDDRCELVDLKTTRSLDPRDWQRTFHQFKYHCQLAFYLSGLDETQRLDYTPYIVAVESEPPFDVGVFCPSHDAIWAGGEEVRELLDRLADCTETGEWPGRYPTEQDLDLPPWAYPSQAEVDDLLLIKRKA